MSNHHRPDVKSNWIHSFFLSDCEIQSKQRIIEILRDMRYEEEREERCNRLHFIENKDHWELKEYIQTKYPNIING